MRNGKEETEKETWDVDDCSKYQHTPVNTQTHFS